MKHFFPISAAATVIALMAVASCSYYTYPLSIERRGPAKVDMDLSGRSISVSFVHSDPKDSVFLSAVADGFATGIEKMYFDGRRAVDIFEIRKNGNGDYASKDTLQQLVMSTDADFVLLLDSCAYTVEKQTGDTLQVKANLYAYDALDRRDTVRTFYGRKVYVPGDSDFPVRFGDALSKSFESTWTKETYQIYFYDEDAWIDAATYAANYEWRKALNAWADILEGTGNLQRKALASYNIAFACYMLEDYTYALLWLDKAEKFGDVAQAGSLRSHIKQRAGSRN